MSDDRLLPTSRSTDLPTFKVLSEGTELPGSVTVISIMVNKSVNKIPLARLVFEDGDAAEESFQLSSGQQLIPGKAIEIQAGYHSDVQTIFKGVVVKQQLRIKGESHSHLVVECKDKSYRLTVGRKNTYFNDQTDSDIMEQVIGGYRDVQAEVESTGVQHREMVQYHVSDWDFVLSRADVNGQVALVDDGKIVIKKPDFSSDPIVTLIHGATVLRFDGILDATHQQRTIQCQAWDAANQAMTSVDAADPPVTEAGNLTSAALAGKVTEDTGLMCHSGNVPAQELQAWADAVKMKRVLSRVRGVITCHGLPQLIPGHTITLQGFGDRFNGKVFVSGVCHQIADGSWEMDVQFGLAPQHYARQPDIRDMPAAGLLPAVNGLQIGVVSQLQDDPDGEYRVLVKMPAVDAEAQGAWARMACLDAGNERGAFFRPEINDEVVLGFLNDDPRDAVILGMLNSSSLPAPVTASDDNHEKGFYPRDQLKLVFNDDQKSIRLETPNGNVVQLSEDEGHVLVTDENGNKVELSSEGIAMESAGDISIKAKEPKTFWPKNFLDG